MKRGRATTTAFANASSVPGRTQTATPASSAAAKPRVMVPKSRVVSLSPTFAGRDLTFWRLQSHISGTPFELEAPGFLSLQLEPPLATSKLDQGVVTAA